MKKETNFLVVSIALLLMSLPAISQRPKIHEDPKYGKDSASRMQCAMQKSVYDQFYKQKNYVDAFDAWTYVYENCPQVSKNVFIHGAVILKYQMKAAKTATEQQQWVDSLMMLYDKRIEYFKDEGKVLQYKAMDLITYRKNAVQETYDILHKSIELSGNKSLEAAIAKYMELTAALFSEGVLTQEVVIENYAKCIDILEAKLTKETKESKKETIQTSINNVEILFDDSGAATCESLIALFTPRFEAAPEDIDLLKKITTLLDKYECTDAELFVNASENLYRLEPSALAAYNLAKMFLKKAELDKAEDYYLEAIGLEEDSLRLSRYYFQLGTLKNTKGNGELVRNYAYKALKYNPTNGEPYLLIGKAYATSAEDCGNELGQDGEQRMFYQNTIYWLAVDKFYKAKKHDPEIAEQADELIKTYSKYFPNKEQAFFMGVNEGDTFEIKCWINEKTTARFN